MKICVCSTPIRPTPSTFPPFGSLPIIQSLRKIGKQASFYNIDYFCYSAAQIEAYFGESQFDLVGISAVVSTSHTYTKRFTRSIRRVSPRTTIVVGGNLAAIPEIQKLPTQTVPSNSLRKIISIMPSGDRSTLSDPMRPLREGR
jgi:hypothetical protein